MIWILPIDSFITCCNKSGCLVGWSSLDCTKLKLKYCLTEFNRLKIYFKVIFLILQSVLHV